MKGSFIAPTVLTGVTHEMRIMNEEIFGPVLPIMTVDSEEEAIELANDSQFGLGASVWTKDRDKGERMARQIQSGMVWVNDHSFSHGACQCSWGGVKDSGLGRSHSKFGFYECVNVKLVELGAGLDPRLLVAALRRGPRQGLPLVGPAPLRPQRQPARGAARGGRCAAAGRAKDAAEGRARTSTVGQRNPDPGNVLQDGDGSYDGTAGRDRAAFVATRACWSP